MIDPIVLSFVVYVSMVFFLWMKAREALSIGAVEMNEYRLITLGAMGWPILSIVLMIMKIFKIEK